MPYRFCIDPDSEVAVVELTGAIDGDECVAAARALHGHPRWERRYDVIWDGRGITGLVIDPRDMKEIVDAKTEDSSGLDVLIVQREVDYLVARLYTYLARSKGKEAHVFTTLDAALEALGLEALPPVIQQWVGEHALGSTGSGRSGF